MTGVNAEAEEGDAASSSNDWEAFFWARLKRNSRVPNQPPAARAMIMIAATTHASQGCSGVTAGGLPVQTGNNIFFVQAQVARHGPHKSAIEDPARKLVPLFLFDRFQESRGNAGCGGYFLKRNAAHLALALQAFAESILGHNSVKMRGLSEYRRAAKECQFSPERVSAGSIRYAATGYA
jgi:hypothetical protein